MVTAATGFIGRALVRQLSGPGQEVRVLLRPSPRSPRLPKGVPVEVSVVSLNDAQRCAVWIKSSILPAGASLGKRGSLLATDIEGTRTLAQTAKEAGMERFPFLSHVGAERASTFPIGLSAGEPVEEDGNTNRPRKDGEKSKIPLIKEGSVAQCQLIGQIKSKEPVRDPHVD